MKERYFDLNSLFRLGNISLCALGVLIYTIAGGNQYINATTIFLLCMICFENLMFLEREKNKREPFVLTLAAFSTVYYTARVVTLLHAPYSVVLNRTVGFSATDTNRVLSFVIISNIAIFLGILCAGRFVRKQDMDFKDQKPFNPNIIIAWLIVGIIVTFFGVFSESIFGRFYSYGSTFFFNVTLLLLFVFVYTVLNWKRCSIAYRLSLICTLTMYVLSSLSIGSRQGFILVITLYFIVLLAIKLKARLSLKFTLVVALLILTSVILFISGTYIRNARPTAVNITVASLDTLNRVLEERDRIFSSEQMVDSRKLIFDRIGFWITLPMRSRVGID